MNYIEHLKRTNGIGEEIHKYLDQYYQLYRGDHRIILHHRKGVELIKKLFGEDMGWVAEQHIKDDFGGWIPESYDDEVFDKICYSVDSVMFDAAKKKAMEIFK